jgi:hypothetical protein
MNGKIGFRITNSFDSNRLVHQSYGIGADANAAWDSENAFPANFELQGR